jgi:hypothetical protein
MDGVGQCEMHDDVCGMLLGRCLRGKGSQRQRAGKCPIHCICLKSL